MTLLNTVIQKTVLITGIASSIGLLNANPLFLHNKVIALDKQEVFSGEKHIFLAAGSCTKPALNQALRCYSPKFTERNEFHGFKPLDYNEQESLRYGD